MEFASSLKWRNLDSENSEYCTAGIKWWSRSIRFLSGIWNIIMREEGKKDIVRVVPYTEVSSWENQV